MPKVFTMSKIFAFLLLVATTNCYLDPQLIKDYFQEKSVKTAQIYSCAPKIERLKLLKTLSEELYITMEVKPISSGCLIGAQMIKRTGVFVDGDCENIGVFLKNCDYFDSQHDWLITVSEALETNLLRAFSKLNLNINSDLQYVKRLENGSKAIFDVYSPSIRKGSALNVTQVGFFQAEVKFTKRRVNLYEDRKDFGGLKFRSIVVLPEKFEGTAEDHVRSDARVQVNHFNRLHSLLNIYCGEFYNFTIDIESTDSWGYKMPNGSYDGVVGGLQRHTIDFGGSPIFLVKERFSILDYGRRTWRLRSAFVFRHPKRKAAFEVFLRPLQKYVWVTIVFAIVVVALILKFVVKFEAQIRGNSRNREIESTWSSMLLMILGALCQQGCSNIPAFISGRIVTIFVFVFSVLLYQFYSGSIVSFLLMQPAKTMNTIRDLAFSDLRMGCEDILYTRQYFKQLFQNKEIARMTKRTYKANAPFYLHPELGLELVSRGGFAYHVDLATAYSIIEKTFQESAICELEEIPFFEARPVMSSFPKGSPFRDAFNYCFQKMAERGIFNRQTKHYHARKPDCIRSNAPTSPVGIDEFYPAMVILSIGVSLSLTVLILEQIVHIHTRKQNKKKLFQFTN